MATQYAPPWQLVDFLDACGVDIFRRWDHVPDGIVFSGCECGYRGAPGVEPVTTLLRIHPINWHGIDVGGYRVGLCPCCGVVKWNRVVTGPASLASAQPSNPYLVRFVADRLRGLLGDGHGRPRRLE